MKQLLIIKGGEMFDSQENFYHFMDELDRDLSAKSKSRKSWICHAVSHHYVSHVLSMPNSFNAEYRVWKVWFEKHFVYWKDVPTVLIGHSLGATFLLKYLSENTFPFPLEQLHLVAGVIDDTGMSSIEGVHRRCGMGDFTLDKDRLPSIVDQVSSVFVYGSQDDMLPLYHSTESARLLPGSHLEVFSTRGHFLQPAFPELLFNIGCYER